MWWLVVKRSTVLKTAVVTQYDVEVVQRIEVVIDKKLELWAVDKEEVALLRERVEEAARVTTSELKELAKDGKGRKRKRDYGFDDNSRDRDDDVVEAGMPMKKKKGKRK